MSLITPDFGLLFWMVIIFGAVFFVLAKFGFPVITGMVEKRSGHIADSLKAADDARAQLEGLAQEQARLIEQARVEQGKILKEASEMREKMLAQAREDAASQASEIVENARREIEIERESAMRDIRREVALLGVEVAEKVVRKELSSPSAQMDFIDRMAEEAANAKLN